MDDLILRSIRGEISNLEERILQNWRHAAPENERRYHQLAEVWRLTPPELPRQEIPRRPALDRIVRAAEARRAAAVPLHRRVIATRSRWLQWSAAAAAAMLIFGLGLAELWWGRQSSGGFGAAEFATGSTETVTVTLTDGTFVRLAPNSRLRLPADGEKREVWLDGRGYFAVAEDASHPFTVRTRVGEALVLGTRFEIRIQEDDLRLAVAEGRVALSAGAEEVEVEAGEVSHVQKGLKPSVVKVADVRDLLDWPGGLLVFQSTPLDGVGQELERHFGVRFEITDPVVAQRKVTGRFTDESLDEVVTAVCRATSARCSIEGERVVVAR